MGDKWRVHKHTICAEESGQVARRHARSVLRTAPPEQIAEILEEPQAQTSR